MLSKANMKFVTSLVIEQSKFNHTAREANDVKLW